MNEPIKQATYDRREVFTPQPRPAWMKTLNDLGEGLDIKGIVPLSPQSLIQQASENAGGLTDFGGDGLEAFHVLMKAIDEEADLHLTGRLLTRAEFLRYLEARLRIVDWCKSHPEVQDEAIDQPVLITGYGRSGTTILFEVLSQDPQFRAAQKWEAAAPVPPPEPATFGRDDRLAKAENILQLMRALSPEHDGKHRSGGDLPVESIELEYLSFASDIFAMFMQIPSYAAWLKGRDLTPTFEWQRTILKILQSRMPARRWLMKSPTHLLYLEKYRAVFPGMRVILTHRDPIVTADSTVSFLGTLYWQRSDKLWGDGDMEVEVLAGAEDRAKAWDPVIAMIQDGRLAKGEYANFYYERFVQDPIAEVRSLYDQLGMTLTDEAAEAMRAYLAVKTQGKHGRHDYEKAPANAVDTERHCYRAYQSFFGVPNEI